LGGVACIDISGSSVELFPLFCPGSKEEMDAGWKRWVRDSSAS
jgi:hypothetical protein